MSSCAPWPSSSEVDLEDLRARAAGAPAAAGSPRTFAEAERDVTQRAIEEHGGNVRAAARALGVSRNMLYRKLAKYNLIRE